jgi:hypothetical protein
MAEWKIPKKKRAKDCGLCKPEQGRRSKGGKKESGVKWVE